MLIDPDFWQDRRVLITGHTGFKGSWLSLWLRSMGATVTGISRGVPTRPSLYELAGAGAGVSEIAADLRDGAGMRDALAHARPEVVLHLAAQPMVRRSISEPALTYEVNVMGTVNVLEAVRDLGDMVRAVVLVTTDRCYENTAAEPRRFVESDRLGGSDPYSSSKAAAELVAAAYRRTYFEGPDTARVASARTGNVIGGGDWGQDRLLPDIMRAAGSGEPVRVHNPSAVRPWQHVLNPLSGYLLLAQELCRDAGAARAWNFGPAAQDERTVGWIVERLAELWDGELLWEVDEGENPPEAAHLAVDSTLAERALGWRPAWDLDEALTRLVEWHRAQLRGEQMRAVTLGQIESFAAATPPA